MDDIAGQPGRKGDDSSRAVLTPPRRGPGLLSPSSPPSGSGSIPSPPSAAAAAAVLALPASATSQIAGLLASSRLAGEMDGGGETLLVRRSKGKKRPQQPAAPAKRGSSGSGDRFRTLWRDYHDLLQVSGASLVDSCCAFALSNLHAALLFRAVLNGFTAGLIAGFLVARAILVPVTRIRFVIVLPMFGVLAV